MLARLLARLRGAGSVTYEDSKALARADDETVRRQLAERTDVRPEVLYYLADDDSASVRHAIAVNTATPSKADLKLARDDDPGVRAGLAAKIARLAPGLTADEADSVRRATYEALEILARDQVARVRGVLAEALKEIADAPPEVIGRLARDAEMIVAAPILEFSPVLTDDDLLEIIAGSTVHGAAGAIARRTPVTEPVADAIVDAGDTDTVATLLSNPSAQIREETLDRLVEQSRIVAAWQGPLVRRPRLPTWAASRLAAFVADSLLEVLKQRRDLPAETIEAVRAEVKRRLDETPAKPKTKDDESPEEHARRLHRAGALDATMIETAIAGGDDAFVVAALAVRAGVSPATVSRAVEHRSAKGIVALTWKAGLGMTLADAIQKRIAKVPVTLVLHPAANGGFPLREDEMEWQLEFLSGDEA